MVKKRSYLIANAHAYTRMRIRNVRTYGFHHLYNIYIYREFGSLNTLESGSLRSPIKLEKWFPFQGERGHSLLLFLYMLIERRRRRGRQNNNSLPKVVTFFTDYQVYHLTLTFIIHNKYTSTLYLYSLALPTLSHF